MKRVIVLVLSMIIMFSVPVFGVTTVELQEKFDATEEQINQNVKDAQDEILLKAYPVGSIYTTYEDISKDDMHDRFEGTWKGLNDTFLWASNSHVGETGGQSGYRFLVTLMPYEEGVPLDTEDGMSKIPVVKGNSAEVEIMPPYTVVKMFKRVR